MADTSLESALDGVEKAADSATRSAGDLGRILKQTKTAAASGKLSDLEKSISLARQYVTVMQERIAALEESWQFDAGEYFESGGYTRELLTAIEAEGLKPADRDGRILCFPSILRVLPGEQAIEVDRRKERRVRPGFVASELKKHSTRQTGMRPQQLIEVLFNAYEPLVAKQKGTRVVRVVDIYDLLTQLPQAKEYAKQEFARDLLQLDMSDVRSTRAGNRLELRADTAVRGTAVLAAVTPDGEVRLYSGVEFRQ